MNTNQNYRTLEKSYLFSTVAQKVNAFRAAHPDKSVILLGIGDVTLPLCPAVISAIHGAADDLAKAETFRGYGPEQGYDFLRSAIGLYYAGIGAAIEDTEIFVGDGAKSDIGNILELFSDDNIVLIPDPVYPVYVDTNKMAGRNIVYMDANEENGFLPLPDPATSCDIIYLCSPNNPTGAAYNKEQLKAWVDYANDKGAIILYDAAYEAFVSDTDLPRSIYEIEGAKTCAIEFCSLSKTAGFTGMRCGYTTVPHSLKRDGLHINPLWLRRQTTKFNGVSYITQRAAAAVFEEPGKSQVQQALSYYKENARIITDGLEALGIWFTGGKNSPYVWFKCPGGLTSWDFFDTLLERANVVGTPGSGFGKNGEHFFRLTAFGDQEKTKEAIERIAKIIPTL